MAAVLTEEGRSPNTLPTLTLIRSTSLPHRGELSWRFGMVLAAINFVILAAAVSNANPRVGRSASLGFSMGAFVVYYNLISLGQNWVATGKIDIGTWLLALHGSAFLLSVGWLLLRHKQWHPSARKRSMVARQVTA